MANVSLSIGHTPNYATVQIGNLQLHYSYSTVIAYSVGMRNTVVRKNVWGPTTGKHLNAIDGGGATAKAERIDGDMFERQLSAIIDRVEFSA